MPAPKSDIFKDFIGILLAGLIILCGYVLFMLAFPGTKADSSSANYETTGSIEKQSEEDKPNLNVNNQGKKHIAPPDRTPSYGFAPSSWDNKQNYPPERAKHNTPQK